MADLIVPDIDLADRLFQQLDRATRQGPGIVRDTYGPGEQAAHDIIGVAAEALELEVKTDAALNLYMTLPGRAYPRGTHHLADPCVPKCLHGAPASTRQHQGAACG